MREKVSLKARKAVIQRRNELEACLHFLRQQADFAPIPRASRALLLCRPSDINLQIVCARKQNLPRIPEHKVVEGNLVAREPEPIAGSDYRVVGRNGLLDLDHSFFCGQ